MWLSDTEFDEVAEQAVAELPAELRAAMDNIVIRVEPEPERGRENLLGLYEGIPLTARNAGSDTFSVPDVVTIYAGPLTRMSRSADELREQIRITVIHEIAHHFGIDDDRLHDLGWG